MKTFTLRLTDLELTALERLAALYKVSKNQLIKDLIIEKYCKLDADAILFDGELDSVSDASCFPYSIEEAIKNLIEKGEMSNTDERIIIFPLRAARYVLDHDANSMTEPENERLHDYITELRR